MTDRIPQDEITIVRESSWLGRAGGALMGAVLGLVAIIAAIGLLTWNESRAVSSISALDWAAGSIISVSGRTIAPLNEGKLVHLSTHAEAIEPVRDPVFGIRASGLLRLVRQVEMFQWEEKTETRTETAVGGRETTTTTYRYSRDWFESPIDSGAFQSGAGHQNPPMPYRSTSFEPRLAKFGSYQLTDQQLRRLDATSALSEEFRETAKLPGGFNWEGDLLYRGADITRPQVGDLRITFRVAADQPVTIVAAQREQGFAPFRAPNGYEIDLLREGTYDAAAMVSQARRGEIALTWALRAAGFVVMLIGFLLLNAPLVWLASLLPPLANLVQIAALGLSLLLALPLTLITIALAWLAFRPMLALGLIIASLVVIPIILRLLKEPGGLQQTTTPPNPG